MALANRIVQSLSETTGIVAAQAIYEAIIDGVSVLAYQLAFTVATPGAKVVPSADIDPDEDTFTLTDHGLVTGLKGQFTTSDTLPTGIISLKDFLIFVLV
jgi:hypothetical protein